MTRKVLTLKVKEVYSKTAEYGKMVHRQRKYTNKMEIFPPDQELTCLNLPYNLLDQEHRLSCLSSANNTQKEIEAKRKRMGIEK